MRKKKKNEFPQGLSLDSIKSIIWIEENQSVQRKWYKDTVFALIVTDLNSVFLPKKLNASLYKAVCAACELFRISFIMVINMHDTASQYETYQTQIVYFIVVVLLMACNLRAKPPPLKKISVSFHRLNLSSYFQDVIVFLKC